MNLASKLEIWLTLGSARRLTIPHKPRNSFASLAAKVSTEAVLKSFPVKKGKFRHPPCRLRPRQANLTECYKSEGGIKVLHP